MTYTEGAPKYIVGGTVGNSFYNFGSSSLPGTVGSFASAALFDGVYGGPGSDIQLTKVWGVRAAYLHNWTPNWETGVFGGYTHVDYNDTASAAIRAALPTANTINGTFNPDFNIWQVGSRTAWTPVKNLTFSGEVLYTYLDQSSSGTILATSNPTGYKPAGTYEFKDQGVWSGGLRVQRTF